MGKNKKSDETTIDETTTTDATPGELPTALETGTDATPGDLPTAPEAATEATSDETPAAPEAAPAAATVAPAATVPITVAAPKRELRPDEEKRMKELGLL